MLGMSQPYMGVLMPGMPQPYMGVLMPGMPQPQMGVLMQESEFSSLSLLFYLVVLFYTCSI